MAKESPPLLGPRRGSAVVYIAAYLRGFLPPSARVLRDPRNQEEKTNGS